MANYILSKQADKDLEDIFDYTMLSYGFDQAEDYLSKIDETLINLCIHPHIGMQRNELKTDLYSILVNKHIIFYEKLEDKIFVARVLHQSKDYRILF